MIYIVLQLIPITVFIWVAYGKLYHKYETITSRWPKLKEIDTVISQREHPLLAERVLDFKRIYISYLIILVISAVSLLYIFYTMFIR